MSQVNVLVTWRGTEEHLERIRSVSERVNILRAPEPEDRVSLVPEAEVWLGWGFGPEQFRAAGKLRWIQITSAGVNRLLFEELRQSDVIVTNASGVYSISMAEQVLGMMLALTRRLHTCVREQSAGRWPGPAVRGKLEVLEEKTCVVLGMGSIGTEIARRAKAFGMTVVGIRRNPSEKPDFVDDLVGPEGMDEALARADFLTIALPLTEKTRHIIDAQALSLMKPSAYIFNVGRGALIDEPALVQALQDGRLAGAGLDVFEKEPLPEDSPLYEMANVIITPHSSGRDPRSRDRLTNLFCQNLQRYLAGQPLLNLVDKQAGY